MADAMQTLVTEGRKRGMEWWTHAEVWRWETARRGVRLMGVTAVDNKLCVRLRADLSLKGATLIVRGPDGRERRLTRDLAAGEVVEFTL